MFKKVVRTIACLVLRPIAKARTRKVVRIRRPSKLIIGGSNKDVSGWLSTDISPRAAYYLDATLPWPIPRASLQYVFGDNMIEHLTLEGARKALHFANIALKPGGTVRLATPDIERTARLYLAQPSSLRAQVLARAKDDNGTPGVYPIDMLRLVITQAGHYLGQMWDCESLTAELGRAGFVNIRRCEMGDSLDPALCNLESREMEQAVSDVTLVLEADKPRDV